MSTVAGVDMRFFEVQLGPDELKNSDSPGQISESELYSNTPADSSMSLEMRNLCIENPVNSIQYMKGSG